MGFYQPVQPLVLVVLVEQIQAVAVAEWEFLFKQVEQEVQVS
jgi:hypothetical protein